MRRYAVGAVRAVPYTTRVERGSVGRLLLLRDYDIVLAVAGFRGGAGAGSRRGEGREEGEEEEGEEEERVWVGFFGVLVDLVVTRGGGRQS